MGTLFYKPEDAWAADFIPFFKDERYHLFYLLDWRDREGHGEGTPWYQVSTTDFVRFTEHGEMLPRGGLDDQDLYVFTGSVIEGGGQYHIFYTGHNPHYGQTSRPLQAVMHAVSSDLLHWTKVPEHTFFAPADRYEPNDWRDPYVFWNEEAGEYWMLLAARLRRGPSRRRGCTALCASKDLARWEVREPLYAPGLYYTHECPDLFRMGEWWYLVFSEFSEGTQTRYRMAQRLDGPWVAPTVDTFDGRAHYAAKTVSDGARRYLCGWNATRADERDDQTWQWGGNLAVHEVWQRSDGTLAVRPPESVLTAFHRKRPFALTPGLSEAPDQSAEITSDSATLRAPGSFGCAVAGSMPERCLITVRVRFDQHTQGCGIVLRASEDLEQGYYIRLEPEWQRLVFDTWPRAGDTPYMLGLERPLALAPGREVTLQVLVEGSVCEVYAGGEDGVPYRAMSTRMYNLPTGRWGVFVQQGAARFEGISLATME